MPIVSTRSLLKKLIMPRRKLADAFTWQSKSIRVGFRGTDRLAHAIDQGEQERLAFAGDRTRFLIVRTSSKQRLDHECNQYRANTIGAM